MCSSLSMRNHATEIFNYSETGESCYFPRPLRKMPYRRTRGTEPMDRILLWALPSLDHQYWSVPRETLRKTIPSIAKNWRLQYNYWRQSAKRSGDRRMANPMDPVVGNHTSQERQPTAVPELLNDQAHQPSKKSHAEDYTEQIEATRRTIIAKNWQASEHKGAPQSRSSTLKSFVRNISSTNKTSTTSSRRLSTGCGMQLCGQPWSTTSAPTLSK